MVGGGEHKVVLDTGKFRVYYIWVDWFLNFLPVKHASYPEKFIESFVNFDTKVMYRSFSGNLNLKGAEPGATL